MTRRRWIADEVSGRRAFLTGDHARHLSQVLRAKVGQAFEIAARGEVRMGRISNIQPDRVEFELGEAIASGWQLPMTVAMSIFKFDRMEWAIEKCVELGVARIVPLIAARTEAHLSSAAPKRVERWKRIARQASEQSRRISPPEVEHPVTLNDLLERSGGLRIVLSEVEQEKMLKDAITPNAATFTLAFGPEGGWKNEELSAFTAAGWVSASLGLTILRAETAVIAAVAVTSAAIQSLKLPSPAL
jgi:16S rRNA (uracil1498-N3)-methyltransferase